MNEDIELKLLAGLPLDIKGIFKIYPLSLKEVAESGYQNYKKLLTNLIADVGDFDITNDVDTSDISSWEIILGNYYYGTDEYRNIIIDAFKMFTKEEISFDTGGAFIIGDVRDNRIIDENVFGNMKYFLKIQNCISTDINEDLGYNIDPSNERAVKMLEKLKKEKEKLNKVKSNSNESLTLGDLISILASNSNLDIMRIFELDIYRFNNQFNRMSILDEYKVNIQSLLAGADPQKIKLTHYISKLQK